MPDPPKLDYATPHPRPVRRATWRDYVIWGVMGFAGSIAAALLIMLW